MHVNPSCNSKSSAASPSRPGWGLGLSPPLPALKGCCFPAAGCLCLLPVCPLRFCSGEAAVTQGGKEVNRLFKADFFGERALLVNEPRAATVAASQATTCLVLDRNTFSEILGSYDKVMAVRVHRDVWVQGACLSLMGHGVSHTQAVEVSCFALVVAMRWVHKVAVANACVLPSTGALRLSTRRRPRVRRSASSAWLC